jgi:hypothetical protein
VSRILPLLFLLVLVVSGYGQSPSSNCPTIVVSGPTTITNPGEPMVFAVDISGPQIIGRADFRWSVSAGSITSGQGTPTITVDTTNVEHGTNVTATVTIQGGLPSCSNTASETAPISPPFACGMPFDQYAKAPWNQERARLDNALIQLNNNPDSRLFIYFRMTSEESFDEARKHARKMMGHFVFRDKDFDTSRVMFVLYVDDRHSTILDLVPPGAKPRFCETGCIQLAGSDLIKK